MITKIQPDTVIGKQGETFLELTKKDSSCPVISLTVYKDIPFIPDESQVIYVENDYAVALNSYLQQNIKTLSSLFKKKEKSLVYIPETYSIIKNNYSYYFPNSSGTTHSAAVSTNAITKQFFSYCKNTVDIRPGLVRYKGKDENGDYLFSYFIFDNRKDTDFQKYFEWYVLALRDRFPPLACLAEISRSTNIDYADYQFDSHSVQIILEIKERMEILRQKGINEMVLKTILSAESKVKISRLVISNEYRIILPDFNNMEIEMYPLPKALFFLFLAHPEGIKFKHIHVYKNDLINIYKQISGRENLDDIEKSIDDVVNPTLNSINEKCSRIREAFISKFDESIAQNYFITGKRGEPKKIVLDRNLLILEKIEIKSEVVKKLDDYFVESNHVDAEYGDLPF